MRLDFKRIMSSVLAFVMLFSSLVMVNVVSVSAAVDSDFSLTAADFFNGTAAPTSGNLDISLSENATKAGISISASQERFDTYNATAINTWDTSLPENRKESYFKDKGAMRITSAGTIKFTPTVNGDVTVYVNSRASSGTTFLLNGSSKTAARRTLMAFSANAPANNEFTFQIPVDLIVLGIDFKVSSTSYQWSLDTETAQAIQNTKSMQGKIGIDTSRTSAENIITYSGSDYMIVTGKERVNVSQASVDGVVRQDSATGPNAYKVYPTEDMFIKAIHIDKSAIKITGAEGRVLHLKCTTHDTFHSIKLDNSGNAEGMYVVKDNGTTELDTESPQITLHEGEFEATIAGGDLTITGGEDIDTFGGSKINLTEAGIEGTFEPHSRKDIDDSAVKAQVIDLTAVRAATELGEEPIFSGTVLGEDYFSVLGEGNGYTLAVVGQDEDQEGSNVQALKVRSLKGSDEGGLAFKIAEGDKSYSVEVGCGIDSEGDTAYIGLETIDGPSTSKVEGSIKKLTKVSDTATFDNLEAGKTYGIYNAGTPDAASDPENDNEGGDLRLYTAKFTASSESPSTDEIKEVLDISNLAAGDLTDIKITGGGTDGNGTDKFKITPTKSSSSTKTTVANAEKTIVLPNKSTKSITKSLSFGGSGNATDNRNIKFTTAASDNPGHVYVYATSTTNDARNFEISEIADGTENNKKQESAVGRSDANLSAVEVEITGGKEYVIYPDANIYIYYIASTLPLVAYETPKQNITVKATNNTAEKVTVTLKDGITFDVPGNATPDSPIQVSDVPEGTYTLSVPSGYKVTPSQITVSAESQEFEITISESNEATVKFTVDSGTAKSNIAITKPDGSKIDNFKTGTISATAEAGEIFKIDVASASSLTDVYGWEASVDGEGDAGKFTLYNHREQKSSGSGYDYTTYINYILPQDAKGKTYTVTFKRKDNAYKDLNTEDQKSGALTGITYGQYGFGEDKINVCGSDARSVVNYAFALPTLCDYSSSYSDSKYLDSIDPAADYVTHFNQYGIINEEAEGSYAEFKIADKSELNLDEAVNTVKVSIDFSGKIKITSTDDTGFSKNLDSTGTFDAKPGCTYKIEDNNSGSKPTYLKSIRLLNNNNVFATDTAAGRTTTKLSTYNDFNSKAEAAGATITTAKDITGDEVQPTDTVFGVITQITLQHKDALYPSKALDDIEAIGYDVYTKADYDKAENALPEGAQYHFNANQTLQDGQEKPEPKEIKFTDTVNTAVDISIDGLTEEKVGTLNPDDKTAGNGENLFVHTYFAVSADKPIVLVPFTIYKSDTSTKVYTNVAKSADNNIIITLDPSAE